MDHPQHSKQDKQYGRLASNLHELNRNLATAVHKLAQINTQNENAVLVAKLEKSKSLSSGSGSGTNP
ncbi:hypothetical protein DAMA08_043480 [Martiniozyma asiatica (nom. inval.)]|nr:hypothetical protein DAMA08_043480 [Martiniozyma asiatica]